MLEQHGDRVFGRACVLRESEVLCFVSPACIALDTTRREYATTSQKVHSTGKHLQFRWCRDYYRRPPLVARTRSRYTERWKNTTSLIARSSLTFVSGLHLQEYSREGCSRLFFRKNDSLKRDFLSGAPKLLNKPKPQQNSRQRPSPHGGWWRMVNYGTKASEEYEIW